jgi:hypothetical protein
VVYKTARTGISPNTVVFPCQYHSTNATYLSSSICRSYQTKWAKPANLSKSNALSKTGGHWVEKYFHLCLRETVSWLRHVGLSPQKLGFDPAPCPWDSWWTKRRWGRGFSEYIGFLLSVSFHQCSILTIIFRTTLSRKTNGPSLGTFKQQWCFGKSRFWWKKHDFFRAGNDRWVFWESYKSRKCALLAECWISER